MTYISRSDIIQVGHLQQKAPTLYGSITRSIMIPAILAISLTALLFAISGFVLGLLGFIQARASALSTHSVQMQEVTQPQPDLSELFGSEPVHHESDQDFSVPNNKLEETLLQGLN